MIYRRRRTALTGIAGATVLIGLLASGCQMKRAPESRPATSQESDYVTAIHDVLSVDGELGMLRNRGTETESIVSSIRAYVAGIDGTDFSGCPEDFTEAFRWHRDAWEKSMAFFERFPSLRGEMHDVFEAIRSEGGETQTELERVEALIWDSWAEVEAVAADYGAIEPSR